MNKAVHALVYVILAVAIVAVFFEIKLYEKKELLTDSNEQLRKCIVDLSSYIEAENAPPAATLEAKQDVSPREAREVDDPEMVNLLEKYNAQYEATNIKSLDWGDAQKAQLRQVYALDSEGNKQVDQAKTQAEAGSGRVYYLQDGPNTAAALIKQIVGRAKYQKDTLQGTRKELAALRTKLQELVTDFNELPKEVRLNKIDIEKKGKEIETLTSEKAAVEDQLQKSKAEVEDLKAEVTSLKEEVSTAKDETEAVKEDLEKSKKLVEQLMSRLKNQSAAPRAAGPVTGGGQLTSGDKGKIASVQNEKLFVIVQFEDAALDEMLGAERNGALPPHEMLVVRPVKGADGKESRTVVGKIRLRQWTPKTNFVTAEILKDWQQGPLEKNDVVCPD